jgi:hypothetical protein
MGTEPDTRLDDRWKERFRDFSASPLRAAAIHACSVQAAKYLFFVWQLEQFAMYGTCMAKHGQRFD